MSDNNQDLASQGIRLFDYLKALESIDTIDSYEMLVLERIALRCGQMPPPLIGATTIGLSNVALASFCKVTDRKIRQVLKSLEDRGLILVHRNAKNGRKISNSFSLTSLPYQQYIQKLQSLGLDVSEGLMKLGHICQSNPDRNIVPNSEADLNFDRNIIPNKPGFDRNIIPNKPGFDRNIIPKLRNSNKRNSEKSLSQGAQSPRQGLRERPSFFPLIECWNEAVRGTWPTVATDALPQTAVKAATIAWKEQSDLGYWSAIFRKLEAYCASFDRPPAKPLVYALQNHGAIYAFKPKLSVAPSTTSSPKDLIMRTSKPVYC